MCCSTSLGERSRARWRPRCGRWCRAPSTRSWRRSGRPCRPTPAPSTGRSATAIRSGVELALSEFLDEVEGTAADRERSGRDLYAELGRGELREGRDMDALLAAYRVGARVAWRRTAAAGRQANFDADTMSLLAEAFFAYVDQLSARSTAGFVEEQSMVAGEAARRRRALLRLLAAVAARRALGARGGGAGGAVAAAPDDGRARVARGVRQVRRPPPAAGLALGVAGRRADLRDRPRSRGPRPARGAGRGARGPPRGPRPGRRRGRRPRGASGALSSHIGCWATACSAMHGWSRRTTSSHS